MAYIVVCTHMCVVVVVVVVEEYSKRAEQHKPSALGTKHVSLRAPSTP
jgi:hypothetical protein